MIIAARRDIVADTKPFSVPHEACLKHNRRSLPQSTKGAAMLQSILNGIYRQFLRNALAGARLGS
jgi:hypothetical protein